MKWLSDWCNWRISCFDQVTLRFVSSVVSGCLSSVLSRLRRVGGLVRLVFCQSCVRELRRVKKDTEHRVGRKEHVVQAARDCKRDGRVGSDERRADTKGKEAERRAGRRHRY